MDPSKRPSWDELFMQMAYLVASRSPDPSTHIGAVIVGKDHEVRSVGYNGLPRGVKITESRMTRPEKYWWMEHAERNAILNAARMGLSVMNCTMYTQGLPCVECSKAVIQSGVSKVCIDKKWTNEDDALWSEHEKRAKVMLKEAGVKVQKIDVNIEVVIGPWRHGGVMYK